MILTEENRTRHETEWMEERLGIGTFLRLFAYKYVMEYIPTENARGKKDLRMAFYLDVDVVIIANLNHLMSTADDILINIEKQSKPRPLWMWGEGNAGFLGINVPDFEVFWDAVTRCKTIRQDPWDKKNDQWLLGHVSQCFGNLTAVQPDPSPWSVHIGHGYRIMPQTLNRTAGMLHLQNRCAKKWFAEKYDCGMDRNYVDKFCDQAKRCRTWNVKAVRNTWGLADYYVRISWDWAIFQSGESRLTPKAKGHKFTLVIRDAMSNFELRT